MAKVSNETRLVIHLFKEKAAKKKEDARSYMGGSQESWARGVIEGFEGAENILAGITHELEHPEQT